KRSRELRPDGRRDEETDAGERGQQPDLQNRDEVLDPGAFLDAERVDRGQERDREDSGDLSAGQVPGPRPDRDGSEDVLRREEGDEAAEVLAESRREGRDAARHDHEERAPAEEEAGK